MTVFLTSVEGIQVRKQKVKASFTVTTILILMTIYSIIDMSRFGLGVLQSPLKAAIATTIFMAALCQMALRKSSTPINWSLKIYLFYILLGIASMGWSYDLAETIKVISGSAVVLLAVIVIWNSQADRDTVIHSLHVALIIIAISSLVLTPFFMANFFDFMQGTLRYSGFGYGAHALARVAAVLILVNLLLIFEKKISKLTTILVIPPSLWIITSSDSRQAMIAALIIIVCFSILILKKFNFCIRLIIGLLLLTLIISSSAYTSVIDFTLFSRDGSLEDVTTFNGRTSIWSEAVKLIEQRPILGYGYGAGGNVISSSYATEFGWTTTSAHNSFLHASVELGILGAIALNLIPLFTLYRGAKRELFFIVLSLVVISISLLERGIAGAPDIFTLLLLLSFRYSQDKS